MQIAFTGCCYRHTGRVGMPHFVSFSRKPSFAGIPRAFVTIGAGKAVTKVFRRSISKSEC